MQKSKQNRNVEATNRESNRMVIIAINREFNINRYTTSWYLILWVLNFVILAREYFVRFYFHDFHTQI